MCSATERLLDPEEEVNAAPSGTFPSYSSVPAHMVWNHLRFRALGRSSGRGQPKRTVACSSCSGVTVRRPAYTWTASGAMASNSCFSASFTGRRFKI